MKGAQGNSGLPGLPGHNESDGITGPPGLMIC